MALHVDFVSKLEENISICSFKRFEVVNYINAKDMIVWRRRTWNSNRAIVLIKLSAEYLSNIKCLGEFSQQIKIGVGKRIGYIPFFYELGLQIIYYGENVNQDLTAIEGYVDKYNNQRVILQSIHFLDGINKTKKSTRTWGQFLTGKYQDIIESTMTSVVTVNLN